MNRLLPFFPSFFSCLFYDRGCCMYVYVGWMHSWMDPGENGRFLFLFF